MFFLEPVLLEMPFIQEILKKYETLAILESSRDAILRLLKARFESIPDDLELQLSAIDSIERLQQLFDLSTHCTDPHLFRLEVLSPY